MKFNVNLKDKMRGITYLAQAFFFLVYSQHCIALISAISPEMAEKAVFWTAVTMVAAGVLTATLFAIKWWRFFRSLKKCRTYVDSLPQIIMSVEEREGWLSKPLKSQRNDLILFLITKGAQRAFDLGKDGMHVDILKTAEELSKE